MWVPGFYNGRQTSPSVGGSPAKGPGRCRAVQRWEESPDGTTLTATASTVPVTTSGATMALLASRTQLGAVSTWPLALTEEALYTVACILLTIQPQGPYHSPESRAAGPWGLCGEGQGLTVLRVPQDLATVQTGAQEALAGSPSPRRTGLGNLDYGQGPHSDSTAVPPTRGLVAGPLPAGPGARSGSTHPGTQVETAMTADPGPARGHSGSSASSQGSGNCPCSPRRYVVTRGKVTQAGDQDPGFTESQAAPTDQRPCLPARSEGHQTGGTPRSLTPLLGWWRVPAGQAWEVWAPQPRQLPSCWLLAVSPAPSPVSCEV